jgi:hypothetical protein
MTLIEYAAWEKRVLDTGYRVVVIGDSVIGRQGQPTRRDPGVDSDEGCHENS